MHVKKWATLTISAVLISACTKKEVAEVDPTPPPVVVVPKPLIQLDQISPLPKGKRSKSTGADISFSNISNDTYQYLLFKATAYDKDGNVIKARKSLDQSAYLRVAGPIEPGRFSTGNQWENTWRSRNVHCLDIEQVEIIFSDGSVEVASGERMAHLNTNTCIAGL